MKNFEKDYLKELIKEGKEYNFDNNKKYYNGEYYSRATPEFLAWVSKIEDYILTNYNENSGPYKMLNSVEKNKFIGHHQNDFEKQLSKLKGAIISCTNIEPNKKYKNNIIINIISNAIFWPLIVSVIAGAYKLGYDNGFAKFDNEKTEIKRQNIIYRDSINLLIQRKENIDTVTRLKIIRE